MRHNILLSFQVKLDFQFIQLFLIYGRWCIEHDVTTRVVLRECDAVTDAIETSQDADETIQTESKTCVRWCSILEGVHQETKLSLGTLWSETEHLEHLLLQLSIVNT